MCERVTKRFGRVLALDDLDLAVPRGAIVGYLGPNGAGKSTTSRIILDLARPDRGTVQVLGQDPSRSPSVRQRIGYLPGELRLDERLTVRETLSLWSRLRDRVDDTWVTELCDRLDLDTSRRTKGLSSGNRRKVGLVGAFMARPELLVLDEPTSGLDPLIQAEFTGLAEEARNWGGTVFLSSHVLSEVQRVADHVIVLREGRVAAAGSVDELRHRARQPFTVQFAGPPPLEELHATPGISDIRVSGRAVIGVVAGTPDNLLAVLARHPILHLVLPEPDLDDVFLQMYQQEAA